MPGYVPVTGDIAVNSTIKADISCISCSKMNKKHRYKNEYSRKKIVRCELLRIKVRDAVAHY